MDRGVGFVVRVTRREVVFDHLNHFRAHRVREFIGDVMRPIRTVALINTLHKAIDNSDEG